MNLLAPFKKFGQELAHIAFPNVCLCCGRETVKKEKYLCSFCLTDRFEAANPDHQKSAANIILPDGVILQHALWKFDKGGELQQLLHALKYDRLISIGSQLGNALARCAQEHPAVQTLLSQTQPLLVPVPLHYLKFRKRGFNQAFAITRGIDEVLDLPVCAIDTVRRQKYTLSQTGFTLEKRMKNMKNAFTVPHPEHVKDKAIIIVDDVFTTGSTSFELVNTLKDAGAASTMIWTVAQA